jgi:hypothetical protein
MIIKKASSTGWLKRLGCCSFMRAGGQAKAAASSELLQYRHVVGRSSAQATAAQKANWRFWEDTEGDDIKRLPRLSNHRLDQPAWEPV